MERGLQKVSSFNKTYSDGKGIETKSEKSHKKYPKSKTKMETTRERLDRRDVCEAS